MVVGDSFAWAHLPKTAGDTTAAMFAAVPGLIRSADARDDPRKHDAFWSRPQDVEGKLLVMNIRRLPAWVLSAGHHRARHGVEPDFRPEPLASPDRLVQTTDPDDLLRWMTDDDRMPIQRWLRTEALLEDMLTLLDELGELTSDVRRRIAAIDPQNVGAYDRTVERWFSTQQLATLYRHNPGWAAVERRVYGATGAPTT